MTTQTALAVAAALVALAFSLSTLERWLDGRRRHDLAWSVALAMFVVASGCLAAGAASGWDAPTFRLFYLFGAILDVPFLALGTVYLLGGRRRGDAVAALVAVVGAFAVGVMTVAPLRGRVPAHRLPQGSEVLGPLPRVLAASASSLGALVVLAGALWSAWRALRARGAVRVRSAPADSGQGIAVGPGGVVGPGAAVVPAPGRLAAANAAIALGTLVLGAGGVLNSVLDQMEGFAISLVVGIVALQAGFWLAVSRPLSVAPGAALSPPDHGAAPPRS
ncbi:MAG: hypothetical protein ACYDAD_05700 [Acidimicrobiales bacterium]